MKSGKQYKDKVRNSTKRKHKEPDGNFGAEEHNSWRVQQRSSTTDCTKWKKG